MGPCDTKTRPVAKGERNSLFCDYFIALPCMHALLGPILRQAGTWRPLPGEGARHDMHSMESLCGLGEQRWAWGKKASPRPVRNNDIGMMYACYSLLNQAGCRLCCKEGL